MKIDIISNNLKHSKELYTQIVFQNAIVRPAHTQMALISNHWGGGCTDAKMTNEYDLCFEQYVAVVTWVAGD